MKKAEGVRDQLTGLIDQGSSLLDDAKGAAKKASAEASKAVDHTMAEAKNSYERANKATAKM